MRYNVQYFFIQKDNYMTSSTLNNTQNNWYKSQIEYGLGPITAI